jgi:hypothetical protein
MSLFTGKPHVRCDEDGIQFDATTFFPFSGAVYTRGHENDARYIFCVLFY